MSFIHLISYAIKGRSMKSLTDIKVDYLTAREDYQKLMVESSNWKL